jgi:hypothetical protein
MGKLQTKITYYHGIRQLAWFLTADIENSG